MSIKLQDLETRVRVFTGNNDLIVRLGDGVLTIDDEAISEEKLYVVGIPGGVTTVQVGDLKDYDITNQDLYDLGFPITMEEYMLSGVCEDTISSPDNGLDDSLDNVEFEHSDDIFASMHDCADLENA